MRCLVLLVLAVPACSGGSSRAVAPPTTNEAADAGGPASSCVRLIEKTYPVIAEDLRALGDGRSIPSSGELVAECEASPAYLDDTLLACVSDAIDQTGVRDCLEAFRSRTDSGELAEPKRLALIGKQMKLHYIEWQNVPTGSTGLTPPTSCCAQPRGVCAPNGAAWSNPVWTALDVRLEEPTRFQYSYESSDGQTATVRARGDLDCDGVAVEYVLTYGSTDNNPWIEIAAPPPNSD